MYGPILRTIRKMCKTNFIKNDIERIKTEISCCPKSQPRLFYLGITAHSNLGDMAQYYCIHNWILKNYPEHKLIEVEADTVVNEKYGFIKLIEREYRNRDIILFQSGYTTQDLGGNHDLMHRLVIEALPDARILMMPQTVFFQHHENKLRSAQIYNQAHNMLFLARDKVSYGTAQEMMPDVHVELFPDIVTSLIGTFCFNQNRRGISLCCRNDGEKYFSEEELFSLIKRFEDVPVVVSDTTVKVFFTKIRKDPRKYIEQQIEYFSRFEAVITDRYHGTIFALAAGTPVVIIRTIDHKVITGADWFKGVYDDYVYMAQDLDDAFQIVSSIRKKNLNHCLQLVFATEYYDKLKSIFESGKK